MMPQSNIFVRFWGVRGSVASPLVGEAVEAKGLNLLEGYEEARSRAARRGSILLPKEYHRAVPFHKRSTFGGNTSCVEVRCGDHLIILDMGTGLRGLGADLFPTMLKDRGLSVTFLLSHVHWDHIQGLPFFGPLYAKKQDGINNYWTFYGGTNWQKTAEVCLSGQMDPPTFPVSWAEIEVNTAGIYMHDVYDSLSFTLDDIRITAGKLNHPQETYGWRIEYGGKVLVYTTDQEPCNPLHPLKRMLELWKDADLVITDSQYTQSQYEGIVGGLPRHGWGHSYAEAIVPTAVQSGAKHVVLFHHDPGSSDEHIANMETYTQQVMDQAGCSARVTAAYEGLQIVL